uniref:Dit-like phage tail protein N-terminal domain-containing protein n=1 Tax=Salmonella phage vB_SEnST11_KE23 TaxID=3161174 RepID=A0AAU8GGC5_9CAUD
MAFVSNNQSKPQQGKATANVEKKVNTAQEASGEVKYTLFASGLNYGGRNVELKDKNYTNDLAIIFDVVEQHSYTRTVDKSSYAVEEKVKFSDHGVIEDGKFSFSARVNSSPVYLIQNNYIDKDTDDQNPVASRRPEKALEVLERLIEDRQLVTLVTEDKIIENYILTSMEASRSNSDGAALVFQLEFTEFRTFTLGKTALATVYSDPKKSGGKTKQKGSVQSSATDEEIEVTARRTKFAGKGKDGWQSIADSMDTGNFTKQDQVVGVMTPDGKIRTPEGNIIDYDKAVGN